MSELPKADLHCHSTYSDGTLSPRELVDLAAATGLKGLSITDHDAIGAFQDACGYAREKEIVLIPGVELSSDLDGENIHVLGYAFDPNSQSLDEFCKIHRKRRIDRIYRMLELLKERGISLQAESIFINRHGDQSFGRPHIAQAMLEAGYVSSIPEAFAKYIGDGRPCYVAGEKWKTQEAVEAIHKANGFAVIAHPHLIPRKKTLKKLYQMPFDGIEAYYARFGEDRARKWLDVAKEFGWFITGGSDFHGDIKPELKLGASFCPPSTFTMLQEHMNKRGGYG